MNEYHYTISEAARIEGISRTGMLGRIEANWYPNAYQIPGETSWKIPASDLEKARDSA